MPRTLRKREQFAEADYAFPAEAQPETPVRAAKPPRTAAALRARTLPAETSEDVFEDNRRPEQRAERELQGHVDMAKWPRVKGWAWDPNAPDERIRLEVAEDGKRILAVLAGISRPDLALAGIGDGLYGFDIDLDDSTLGAGRHVLHLRCAETGAELPGGPILLDVPPTAPAQTGAAKAAGAAGPAEDAAIADGDGDPDGLRRGAEAALAPERGAVHRAIPAAAAQGEIAAETEALTAAEPAKPFSCFVDEVSDNGVSGWIMVREEPSCRCVVALREDGRLLSRAVASQFRPDLLSAGIGDGCHAFTLPMPRSLLDGEEHLLEVIEQESGLVLEDEPIRWRSAAGTGDKALAGPAPPAGSAAPTESEIADRFDGYPPAEARRPPLGGGGPGGGAATLAALARRGAPLAGNRTTAPAAIGTRVLIDVSDLVYYIGRHPNLTGIQRVQSSIVLSIVEGGLLPRAAVTFLVFNARSRRWMAIPTAYLISVLKDLFLPEALRPMSFATDEVRDGILPGAVEFTGAGLLDDGVPSVLCLLGAAWVQRDYFHRVAAMKRRFGTKFVMVLHDLIPVYARETCDQDTARVFDDFLRRALRHVDHVLSISENTAKDLQRYARSVSVPVPPITVTQNGSSFDEFLPEGGIAAHQSAPDAVPERFVLFVATVEGRKNHRLILDIWRRMLAEGDDPPHLVCVGRVGWRSEPFVAKLVETNYLNGRVVLLQDISDADLKLLYSRCLFTVFPSLYEGWGLPVGESLAAGKICVCSNRASLPEVAGAFGVYIDIDDPEQSLRVVRGLIADAPGRKRLEQNIRRNYQPIAWRTVAERVVAACKSAAEIEWREPYPYPAIPYSAETSFAWFGGDDQRTSGDELLARIVDARRGYFLRDPLTEESFLRGEEARAGGVWAEPENWGTWLCHGGGEIVLGLAPEDSELYHLFLRLRASGPLADTRIRLIANGEPVWEGAIGPQARNIITHVRRRGPGTAHWLLRLRVEVEPSPELRSQIAALDRRVPTIGFERLVVVPENDLKTRVDILYTLLP